MQQTELIIEFPKERGFSKDSFSKVLRGYKLGGHVTWVQTRVVPCPCYHILVNNDHVEALLAKAAAKGGLLAVKHERGHIDRFVAIQLGATK